MNWDGIVIGAATFLIIGLLHPVVIKAEYFAGKGIWPLFLVLGSLCITCSVLISSVIPASLLAVLGFSLLWSIRELFEQEKRVQKGWFPRNPNKKSE